MRLDAVATVAETSAPETLMDMSNVIARLMVITSDMYNASRDGANDGQAMRNNGRSAND